LQSTEEQNQATRRTFISDWNMRLKDLIPGDLLKFYVVPFFFCADLILYSDPRYNPFSDPLNLESEPEEVCRADSADYQTHNWLVSQREWFENGLCGAVPLSLS